MLQPLVHWPFLYLILPNLPIMSRPHFIIFFFPSTWHFVGSSDEKVYVFKKPWFTYLYPTLPYFTAPNFIIAYLTLIYSSVPYSTLIPLLSSRLYLSIHLHLLFLSLSCLPCLTLFILFYFTLPFQHILPFFLQQ